MVDVTPVRPYVMTVEERALLRRAPEHATLQLRWRSALTEAG